MEKKYIQIFNGYRGAYGVANIKNAYVDPDSGKLKLKPGKDYDVGAGSSRSFMLDIDVKHLDKVVTLLMKNKIRTK